MNFLQTMYIIQFIRNIDPINTALQIFTRDRDKLQHKNLPGACRRFIFLFG